MRVIPSAATDCSIMSLEGEGEALPQGPLPPWLLPSIFVQDGKGAVGVAGAGRGDGAAEGVFL